MCKRIPQGIPKLTRIHQEACPGLANQILYVNPHVVLRLELFLRAEGAKISSSHRDVIDTGGITRTCYCGSWFDGFSHLEPLEWSLPSIWLSETKNKNCKGLVFWCLSN